MKKLKSGFYFRFSLCTKVVKLRRFYISLHPDKILKASGDKRALVEMILKMKRDGFEKGGIISGLLRRLNPKGYL